MNCWLKHTRWALIGIVLAGLVTDVRALDPNRLLSQYVREQWNTENGFPGRAVNGIAQTSDGYLWIGTDRGLIRFDGFNFKPVSFASIGIDSNVPILQLITDAGGTLWIRPQGTNLVRRKNGNFEVVRFALYAITALSKGNNDGILISDIGRSIFRAVADDFQTLGPPPPGPVVSMAETADGKIWLATLGGGLVLLTGGQSAKVNSGLLDRKINCLLPIGRDELWVGTDRGLYRGNSKGFRRIQLPQSLGSDQVLSIALDRDMNTWVGTMRGLFRINTDGISLSEEDELRAGTGINALFEDREGNLWIGGTRWLDRIRDSAFVSYSSVGDHRFEHNGPVYVDPKSRSWFAPAQGGLWVLENGRVQAVTAIPARDVVYSISGRADEVWAGLQRGGLTRLRFRDNVIEATRYTEKNGLAQNSVYAAYESRDGSVWAGTINGGVSNLKDGRFTTYTTRDGLASNTIFSILETHDGAKWFATPDGLSSFSNGRWRTYKVADGLPSPEVNCLFEDSSGILWGGTSGGLAFLGSNRFQIPHKMPDVLREQIFGMTEDKSGRLWIATSGHVLRVPRDKLLSGVVKAVDIQEYGRADGLESTEGVKRDRSVVSDSYGRIWFSLHSGLSVVAPSKLNGDSPPALPHIEAITTDGNALNLAASVQIPPSPKRITFEYTGLSLAAPERIRFRYFLENFDSDWSEPLAPREAVYTNLAPGFYRFRLVASNSDGLWNGPETAIAFNVAPAYYQTYWFRLSCVAVFITLLWALYQLRSRQLARQFNMTLEARVAERTRIARELHDTLLQGFQGITLRVQGVAKNMPKYDPLRKMIDDVLDGADEVLREARHRVRDLRRRTTGENELADHLTKCGQELSRDHSTSFTLAVVGEPKALESTVQDEAYRIAREALTNAFQHASASKIETEVTYDSSALRIRVRDDGVGIDKAVLLDGQTEHWGVTGMRERACAIRAQLNIWSRDAAGTEVELVIPASIAYPRE